MRARLSSFLAGTLAPGVAGACAAAALLVAAGCGAPGDPPAGAETQPGFRDYGKYCARCHGDDGRSGNASRIARKPVDLTERAWREGTSRGEVETVIREGKGRMKGLGSRLTPEQVRSLAAYTLWLSAAADTLVLPGSERSAPREASP